MMIKLSKTRSDGATSLSTLLLFVCTSGILTALLVGQPGLSAPAQQRKLATSHTTGSKGLNQGKQVVAASAAALERREKDSSDEFVAAAAEQAATTTLLRRPSKGADQEAKTAPQIEPLGALESNIANAKIQLTGQDMATAAGHHHGKSHGKYYMYTEVPKKHAYKMGFKRGNHKHTIERKESVHKSHVHSYFKWHDKKGKGSHKFEFKHDDHKKKHHY